MTEEMKRRAKGKFHSWLARPGSLAEELWGGSSGDGDASCDNKRSPGPVEYANASPQRCVPREYQHLPDESQRRCRYRDDEREEDEEDDGHVSWDEDEDEDEDEDGEKSSMLSDFDEGEGQSSASGEAEGKEEGEEVEGEEEEGAESDEGVELDEPEEGAGVYQEQEP